MQQTHESLTVIQKYDQIQILFLLTVYSILISNNKEIAFAVRWSKRVF